MLLASLPTQIADFFANLLNTKDWPPRWHCGKWSDFHGWLYIISDLGIWAAYFAIPVLIVKLLLKRNDIPFHRVFILFVAFILLCGFTHFVDALIFWWPAYRFSALLRFITAVVSIATVYALNKIMPLANNLRTVSDLENEIEKRKVIEDKLASSEFLLSEAGRIGRVGGWEYDAVSNISILSKTVYDIYELPYNSNKIQHDSLDYFQEPYRQKMRNALSEVYKTGKKWDLELLMTTEQNNDIWVRSIGEPLYDTSGKLIKLRGVFMDINNYKLNEITQNKNLEIITKNNLQLKNFTHILSHNIRNHASNISVILSLCDATSLTEDNAELFDKIMLVSGSLNDTLNDLSEAIKIRENPLVSEQLSFAEVTRQALNIIVEDIKAANATITTEYDIKTVTFPKIYLESIILNLLTNAIKYKKDSLPPMVLLRTYKNELGNTVLECADNGRGIDLKLHGEKLFGLYKTFHNRSDSRGVGLYLTKNQVESQKGTITVESTPNVGTTFKIVFNEEN